MSAFITVVLKVKQDKGGNECVNVWQLVEGLELGFCREEVWEPQSHRKYVKPCSVFPPCLPACCPPT